jgi:hypothetical protein
MGTNLVEKAENLPTPERTDQLHRRANRIIRGLAQEPEESRQAIVAELEALSRPAAKAEIAQHLAVMLQSFPNAGNANREIFVRVLAEDVGASQPSIGVLELACRNLRRTARFMPTINETLEALAEAERERASIFYQLGNRRQRRRECSAEEMLPQRERTGF